MSDEMVMVALWCILGLIVSAVCVSTRGAAFSINGLSQLFSGAATAIIAMSASLELAKFVLAAYLHQSWNRLNIFFKAYLLLAIVVLSVITSMGIFGFLSNAYQSASSVLEAETVKIDARKADLARVNEEVARLNKSIDEVPANHITKKMQVRAEAEPALIVLRAKIERFNQDITQANLQIIEVKKKVGPLIYITKAFKMDIDDVVKYLIMIFVFVFDPLAICLVIATSEALETRRRLKAQAAMPKPFLVPQPAVAPAAQAPVASVAPQAETPASPPSIAPEGEVVQMRFAAGGKDGA
jgi:hypothetical protein